MKVVSESVDLSPIGQSVSCVLGLDENAGRIEEDRRTQHHHVTLQ
jgi:hypothetical protein